MQLRRSASAIVSFARVATTLLRFTAGRLRVALRRAAAEAMVLARSFGRRMQVLKTSEVCL
jgi:hypothetical protein